MSSYTHAVRVGKTWTPKPAFMASSLAPIKTRSGSLSSQSPILDQAIAKRRMPMLPVVVFGISIVAYTAQSELAQWVTAQGWRKPYLMMYITHSLYSLLFPLAVIAHWASPNTSRKKPLDLHLKQLRLTLLALQDDSLKKSSDRSLEWTGSELSYPWLLRLVAKLAFFLTVPSLSWFLAVGRTSMSDITAIYNTNAFFAYIIAVVLGVGGERWSIKRLMSVIAACLGVVTIVYGDMRKGEGESGPGQSANTPGSIFLGDCLAAIGSIGIGYYEVFYKLRATPPAETPCLFSKDDVVTEALDTNRSGAGPASSMQSWQVGGTRDLEADEEPIDEIDGFASSRSMYGKIDHRARSVSTIASIVSDPDLGQGLDDTSLLMFSAFLTSLVGLLTVLTLWMPLPILHSAGWEEFGLPESNKVALALYASAFCGVIFNGGLMMLIAIWGPVVASVGNLITIVSVALVDWLLLGHSLSFAFLIGSGMIVAAFLSLSFDMKE